MATNIDKGEMSATAGNPPSSKDDAFLSTMRKRLDRSVENEADERAKGLQDTRFINGDQWEESTKAQRGKKRLTLVINKMPAFLDQVDGDMRLNTPGIKIKAVDNDADPDTADVIEGIIRYVERNSAAQRVHSYAGVHAAAGGRGAWRVLTDYVSDDSFDQDIKIKRIVNPYSVYFDPAAEDDDKQDGMYMFLMSDIDKDEYKEEYGNDPVDFSIDGEAFSNWQSGEKVRVAEYFYKEKTGEKTLYLLDDGTVTEEKPAKGKAKRTRKVPIYKMRWAKVDGKRVLDREDVPGIMFPIVLTWGKQLCVDGKIESRGLARHSKDAQRLYNYFRSNDAEAGALQPKQPYLMPDTCIGPFKEIWDKSNDENYPYLPYHVDANFPNHKPFRESPAMASSANQAQIQIADDEMRDTVGIQKAALGQPSNETSGVAIQRRKQESDTGQYAFLDNLAAAIRTEGKIILGMIPEIIDTEREIRMLGKDMKEKVVRVNSEGGIDLTTGKYDVDITTEGSYSTQREEFQQKLESLLPHMQPEQVNAVSDIFFEMQDFPRSEDIAARLKKLIPPQILAADESGDTMQQGEGGGPGQPAEGAPGQPAPGEPAAAPQPSPVEQAAQEAAVQKLQIDLQTAQLKMQQEQAKLEGLKLENELKLKVGKDDIRKLIAEMVANPAAGGAAAPQPQGGRQ